MKLSLGILLSLLGHGIILMPWSGSTELAINSTPSSFQVTLLQQPANNSKIIKHIKQNIDKKLSLIHKSDKNAVEKISITSQPEQVYSQSNKINTYEKSYVISQIKYKMENHFRYPLLARRNGWQGKVIIGLQVEPDGSIENVHIKSGSGYNILDQSALNALLKIKQLQHLDNWLNFHNQEIFIPVIYRLEEG